MLAAAVLTNALLGTSADPGQTDVVATLGAFALGGLLWWRLVEVPGTASIYRGGGAGVLTGLFADFVAWFVHFVWRLVTVGMGDSAPEVPGNLASYVIVFGGTSTVVTGVVVGPVGRVIGIGLARLRRPDSPPAGGAPDRTE